MKNKPSGTHRWWSPRYWLTTMVFRIQLCSSSLFAMPFLSQIGEKEMLPWFFLENFSTFSRVICSIRSLTINPLTTTKPSWPFISWRTMNWKCQESLPIRYGTCTLKIHPRQSDQGSRYWSICGLASPTLQMGLSLRTSSGFLENTLKTISPKFCNTYRSLLSILYIKGEFLMFLDNCSNVSPRISSPKISIKSL